MILRQVRRLRLQRRFEMSQSIQLALAQIQRQISQACESAGRSSSEVELIAVTKTFDASVIRQAYDLGLRQFGENKVQELLDKTPELPSDIRWHMIGRLQTNKVKMIIGQTALIHSLDRVELFEKIASEARKKNLDSVECLLQLNVSGEASKAGFSPEEAEQFLNGYDFSSAVKIKGLMTMAPLTEDQNVIRAVFKSAHMLFKKWKEKFPQHAWQHLSMGMSGDYTIAIEEGATLVRIGTAIFGHRPQVV